MTSTDYFDARIAEREKMLVELDEQEREIQRKKSRIQGELAAYRDAKGNAAKAGSALGKRNAHRITSNNPGRQPPNTNGHDHDFSELAVQRMSPGWRVILTEMAATPGAITTTTKMSKIASGAGHPIIGQSLRSGAFKYCERKWIERVKQGEYRITPLGTEVVKALAQ